MRRLSIGVALLMLAMALGFGFGRTLNTDAQDDSASVHPVVGSWVLTGFGGYGEAINSYTSDGLVHVSGRGGTGNQGGGMGHGAWEMVDDHTAAITAVINTSDPSGNQVLIIQRGTITVDESGNNFLATGVFQIISLDGESLAVAPVEATGERIVVEPVEAAGPIDLGDFAPDEFATPTP